MTKSILVYYLHSLITGKLATNELPLPDNCGDADDANSYSNPLTIVEDAELETCPLTRNRMLADKK